jgi:hypothetical protein
MKSKIVSFPRDSTNGETCHIPGVSLCAVSQRSRTETVEGLEHAHELAATLTATFWCNEDAGVEDYSHAERSRGLRLLMISLKSAKKSGSIVGS